MYEFFIGIVVPIIVLLILITFLSTLSKMVLDLIRLNSGILRIILFFILFHFAGKYVYDLLNSSLDVDIPNFIEILYTPTHYVITYLKSK